MRRFIALVLAILLPPAGVFLSRGFSASFVLVLVLFSIGQGVFWYFAAGPGLLLWFASVIVAGPMALILPRSS